MVFHNHAVSIERAFKLNHRPHTVADLLAIPLEPSTFIIKPVIDTSEPDHSDVGIGVQFLGEDSQLSDYEHRHKLNYREVKENDRLVALATKAWLRYNEMQLPVPSKTKFQMWFKGIVTQLGLI